jgi:hypothetical protein
MSLWLGVVTIIGFTSDLCCFLSALLIETRLDRCDVNESFWLEDFLKILYGSCMCFFCSLLQTLRLHTYVLPWATIGLRYMPCLPGWKTQLK